MTGHSTSGLEPWSHDDLQAATLRVVRSLDRIPLTELPPDRRPGAYLHFTASGDPLWGPFGDGTRASYAGSCTSLADRMGRHRRTFAALRDLRPEDVWVIQFPTSTRGIALYVEDMLVSALNPPLSAPALAGLGSRQPGRIRANGRQSRFDDLCPGRSWARQPGAVDRARAVADLALRVAAEDGAQRWPPLR